jgi:hypothetical protein
METDPVDTEFDPAPEPKRVPGRLASVLVYIPTFQKLVPPAAVPTFIPIASMVIGVPIHTGKK